MNGQLYLVKHWEPEGHLKMNKLQLEAFVEPDRSLFFWTILNLGKRGKSLQPVPGLPHLVKSRRTSKSHHNLADGGIHLQSYCTEAGPGIHQVHTGHQDPFSFVLPHSLPTAPSFYHSLTHQVQFTVADEPNNPHVFGTWEEGEALCVVTNRTCEQHTRTTVDKDWPQDHGAVRRQLMSCATVPSQTLHIHAQPIKMINDWLRAFDKYWGRQHSLNHLLMTLSYSSL